MGGGTAEFNRLSARWMEIVRTQDSGTLQYDVYVDELRARMSEGRVRRFAPFLSM